MTQQLKLLDHGYVRLVDSMGDDLSIVRAARVSYDADWRAGEDSGSDTKLINYLWKNKHTSPFEAVTFTFEIKAPIFIFRQWHRHRTWSYNEVSARYTELPDEYYLPNPKDIGIQSTTNKQGRVLQTDVDHATEDELTEYKETCAKSFKLYRYLLAAGWPRELARMVLPLSTYSRMFATVNLLNLLKFLSLRDHAHAQYEIQVYARALKTLAKEVAPIAVAAWEKENGSSL